MKIIQVKRNQLSAAQLKEAVQVLKRGGVVAYPTETAYGLGADATNSKAVAKVYKIKKRGTKRPMLIMISAIKDLNQWAYISQDALKLAKKFWPGPLTLVLKKKNKFPANITSGKDNIGVRFPKNKIANLLVKSLGRPITSTSASISGQANLYSGKKIAQIFKSQPAKPDLIIDAGRLPIVKPSTILDLTVKPYQVIRKGPVKIRDIERVVKL